MSEYIGAELAGRKEGDCFKFERDCSRFCATSKNLTFKHCHSICRHGLGLGHGHCLKVFDNILQTAGDYNIQAIDIVHL